MYCISGSSFFDLVSSPMSSVHEELTHNSFWPEKVSLIQTAQHKNFHSLLHNHSADQFTENLHKFRRKYKYMLFITHLCSRSSDSSRRWEGTRRLNQLPWASINKVEIATGSSNEVWKVLT